MAFNTRVTGSTKLKCGNKVIVQQEQFIAIYLGNMFFQHEMILVVSQSSLSAVGRHGDVCAGTNECLVWNECNE